MTADERYAECKTIKELNREYERDRYGADSWEYLNACEKAYQKHINRLRCEEMGRNNIGKSNK